MSLILHKYVGIARFSASPILYNSESGLVLSILTQIQKGHDNWKLQYTYGYVHFICKWGIVSEICDKLIEIFSLNGFKWVFNAFSHYSNCHSDKPKSMVTCICLNSHDNANSMVCCWTSDYNQFNCFTMSRFDLAMLLIRSSVS